MKYKEVGDMGYKRFQAVLYISIYQQNRGREQ